MFGRDENYFPRKWISHFTMFGKNKEGKFVFRGKSFSLEWKKILSLWIERKLILCFSGAHTVSHSFSLPCLLPRHMVRRFRQWHIVLRLSQQIKDQCNCIIPMPVNLTTMILSKSKTLCNLSSKLKREKFTRSSLFFVWIPTRRLKINKALLASNYWQ